MVPTVGCQQICINKETTSKIIEKAIFAKIGREYGMDTSDEIIELMKNYLSINEERIRMRVNKADHKSMLEIERQVNEAKDRLNSKFLSVGSLDLIE